MKTIRTAKIGKLGTGIHHHFLPPDKKVYWENQSRSSYNKEHDPDWTTNNRSWLREWILWQTIRTKLRIIEQWKSWRVTKKKTMVVKVINHRKGTKKKRNNSAWEKITKTFVVVTNIFNFYIYSFGCCYMLISVRSESGTGVTNECAM